MCRTDDGINIGVIESINTRGNDSPSSSSPSSNHHEDDYDTPCGEILGLASCEEMELFQNKLKKESYLLEICQDYLHEYQELATDIEIIDIEFLMNGSVNIYYYPLQESGG